VRACGCLTPEAEAEVLFIPFVSPADVFSSGTKFWQLLKFCFFSENAKRIGNQTILNSEKNRLWMYFHDYFLKNAPLDSVSILQLYPTVFRPAWLRLFKPFKDAIAKYNAVFD